MQIDYKQELLNLLNQPFYTMPSKEVISSDKNIALSVWNNYSILELDSLNKNNSLNTIVNSIGTLFKQKKSNNSAVIELWYLRGNWKSNLEAYKNNIAFWDEAIKKYNYEIVLNKNFQKDFPTVTDYYIKDINQLKEIFYLSKNLEFFKLMNCSKEEKKEIFKEYMKKNPELVTENDIKLYGREIEDKNFFVTVLRAKPQLYQYVHDKYKADEQLIRIALQKVEGYRHVPENLKEKYFSSWYELYKHNLNATEVQFLPRNLQEKVVTVHPDLLAHLMNTGGTSNKNYVSLINCALSKKPEEFINYIRLESLRDMSLENQHIASSISTLQKLVSNYSYKETKEYFNKIVYLSSFNESLKNTLESNPCYQLHHASYMNHRLHNSYFEKYFDYLISKEDKKKMSQEKIENLLLFARGHLSIEDLKQHRYPKNDLYTYMKRRKLMKDLEENLSDDKEQTNRTKI